MRWTRIVVVLAAAAGIAWWWSGGQEQRVRARLDEAAAAVGTAGGEAEIARVTRAATLARSLAKDVVLVAPGGRTLEGRDAVLGAASRLASASPFTIRLADVEVNVTDDERRAMVTATALVEGGSDPQGVDGQEFRFELRRHDGDWLITRAEAVAALERPD